MTNISLEPVFSSQLRFSELLVLAKYMEFVLSRPSETQIMRDLRESGMDVE